MPACLHEATTKLNVFTHARVSCMFLNIRPFATATISSMCWAVFYQWYNPLGSARKSFHFLALFFTVEYPRTV